MLLREDYENREQNFLAPYATKVAASLGRKYKDEKCSFRSLFQHDKDRIVHSEAFRRLEYKTQVFVNHEGDYYRTRLTHTLEVAQIARGIARTLRLNEDLAEAISLAHDLGHTPFGHAGESTLNNLMSDVGGFEHNHQSFRVVTLLEQKYPDFPGLNLSFEILEGIARHTGEYDDPSIKNFKNAGFLTIEAQIVNLADEIAYMNHDLDDGLQSGMLTIDQMNNVELWKNTFEAVKKKHPEAKEKILKHRAISSLINFLVCDVQDETLKRIKKNNISSFEDVRKKGDRLVSFSQNVEKQTKQLKDYLFENLYNHYRVARMADKAQRILEDIFHAYLENSRILPRSLHLAIQQRTDNAKRLVCDYVAGMTDRYALMEHKKLFDPHARV